MLGVGNGNLDDLARVLAKNQEERRATEKPLKRKMQTRVESQFETDGQVLEVPQSLVSKVRTTPNSAAAAAAAAETGHDFARKSHHLTKTNNNLISVDNLTDKYIEIVVKFNEHSNLLVNIILLAAMVFMAWGMYEMGYLGYTPTRCV
jgi:hypothetical protein